MKDEVFKQVLNEVKGAGGVVQQEESDDLSEKEASNPSPNIGSGNNNTNNSNKVRLSFHKFLIA